MCLRQLVKLWLWTADFDLIAYRIYLDRFHVQQVAAEHWNPALSAQAGYHIQTVSVDLARRDE